MLILASFVIGMVCVVAEYACRDPQGFHVMVTDTGRPES